ncbi:MAG: hypothetical protein K8S55_06860 [Phycisphaerae bacterium]|nr:hypothetical protein [Phycisphaerae bacterium]
MNNFFAYRSFWHNKEVNRHFAEIGVREVCFFPANTLCMLGVPYSKYPPVWVGPGQYNFSSLDKQIEDLRTANPNARLICMIDLNTPDWWIRLNGGWGHGFDSYYEFGRVAASEEWRRDTCEYLEAFLKHTESHHRDSIGYYTINCGTTTEWQDPTRGEESQSRCVAWRKWMIDKGLPDPIDIPPASVREHVSHGIFRDPVTDALAINYWRFCNWLVGDTILHFAACAQKTIKHRIPLGTFYGYVLEHTCERLISEGHLDFDRVYHSPDIDFFNAPDSYRDREIGGAGGFMVCVDSLKHHGKVFIHEIDHRTHSAKSVPILGKPIPGHEAGLPDEESTIVGLRREFAKALTHGTSLWWFDMFGGWYEGERVMNAIGQMRELWDRLSVPQSVSVAEIAFFVDAESMFYLDSHNPLLEDFLNRQRYGLGRTGAPYDIFSFTDIPDLDLSQYKLVIFPNLFVIDDTKKKWLKEKVCIDGKTVVWGYAPGIIADNQYDPGNVEQLTGIRFDAKELTVHSMDNWTSVFSPEPNIPAATLRRLAVDAGVHIYCDAEEPLYANHNLLSAHTKEGGERSFSLPRQCKRITELFSGRILAENVTEFSDNLPAPGTVLYELEWE